MKMQTQTLTALCTALLVGLAAPSANAGNVSEAKFAARIGDMAKAAKASYGNGTVASVSLSMTGESQNGTVAHSNVAEWSTDVVQVYKGVTGDTSVSIIISFRGTQATPSTPVVATGDLLRDLQGAVIRKRPQNPWLGTQEKVNNETFVGRGFNRRVENYMQSSQGQQLKKRIDDLEAEGKEVEIHVTGHSLGAISSQIFSFYLAQYMRINGFSPDKFKINNFGFNTPRGVGSEFAKAFEAEIGNRYLTAYSFTIAGDPVSDWTLAWLSAALPSAKIQIGDEEYCPGAQLETVDPTKNPVKKLNNHWLDDDAIFKFGALGQYQGIDADRPACMAKGYFSFL